MIKIIARIVGLLSLTLPVVTFALGLGPITMRSSLNQPLDAEIEIHSIQPGDLDGLAVRLASEEDFARVSVERPQFLTRITFQVKTRADGTAFIHLSTNKPIVEPYLDFLIEARWPRGRALKEYTVLVDPPVLTAEAPAPVEQAAPAPVFTQPAPKSTQRSRPSARDSARDRAISSFEPPSAPPPVRREAARVTAEGEISYEVKRNDTLWEIALQMRPDDAVSVHQMMLAFLRDNPKAFYDNNINKLKAGVVLRIKDASTISDMSKREAIAQVREQNLAWREGQTGRLTRQVETADSGVVSDDSEASRVSSSRRTVADDARLKLVAPGKEEDLGSGGASRSADAKKVKEDLLLASEALDANRQEGEELQSRMSELEEQFQSMQRLIMLKDEELLALQNQLGIQEPEKAQVPEANKVKPKPQQASADDALFSDPILLGLAGLLVVAIIGWLVVRRKKMHEGFEESILNVGMAHKASGAAAATADITAAPSMQPESAMVSDFSMSGMTGMQSDSTEVDPISEADVYLAYGRHQQAEDIIKQALDKTPDRLELHSKLLEVYHAARNVPAFENEAQSYFDKIGGNESDPGWSEIAAWGREIAPSNALFGGGDMAAAEIEEEFGVSADEEDLLDFDFDEDTTIGVGSGARAQSAAAEEDDALDFDVSSLDFDLDADEQHSSASITAESMAAVDALDAVDHQDDNSLDFELSLDEDEAPHNQTQTYAKASHTDHHDGGLDFTLDDDKDDTVSLRMKDDNDFAGFELESDAEPFSSEEEPAFAFQNHDDDEAVELADVVALDTSDDDGLDLDSELDEDIFANVDEIGTKLDLAKAYVDMGDSDGARSILDEVLEEGDPSQKQQAEALLAQMG